jgi:hypothetical protein
MRRASIMTAVVSAIACGTLHGADDAEGPDVGVDAASDAGADAIDASSCDGTFCEDFDHAALGAAWEPPPVVSDASLDLDDTAYVSPPRSLRVTFAGGTNGGAAYLQRTFSSARGFHCSFEVRVSDPSTDFVDFLVVTTANTTEHVSYYAFEIGIKDGVLRGREDISFTDGGASAPRRVDVAPSPFPAGVWQRVDVVMTFTTASLSVAGVVVWQDYPYGGFVPGDLLLQLGGQLPGAATPTTINLDDLVCTFE